MKTLMTMFVFVGLSSMAQAQTPPAGGADHPCRKVEEACKAAGYVKGDHKDKKGLFMDCIKPLLAGQTVAGVTVDPAELKACEAKKAAHVKK